MTAPTSNYPDIRQDVIQLLTKTSEPDRMKHHILPVVNNALRLAERLNADAEVVELAAYFHDFTRITGDKANHHNSSADIAREFLEKYHYPEAKIRLVEDCIRHHRGSLDSPRNSVEEKIVCTADAMAHLQKPLPFFHKWYGRFQMSIDDGARETREKMERTWNKIQFDFVKEEMKDLYNYLTEILK